MVRGGRGGRTRAKNARSPMAARHQPPRATAPEPCAVRPSLSGCEDVVHPAEGGNAPASPPRFRVPVTLAIGGPEINTLASRALRTAQLWRSLSGTLR